MYVKCQLASPVVLTDCDGRFYLRAIAGNPANRFDNKPLIRAQEEHERLRQPRKSDLAAQGETALV